MPIQRQQQKEVKQKLFVAEVKANGEHEGDGEVTETLLVRAKSKRAALVLVAEMRISVRQPSQDELLSLGKGNMPVLMRAPA